jgi:hypothetical protein
MTMKKQIQKSTFLKEKYQNNDDDFFIGNKFNNGELAMLPNYEKTGEELLKDYQNWYDFSPEKHNGMTGEELIREYLKVKTPFTIPKEIGKRLTKRRENVISLLDKFDEESNIIKIQIKKINADLNANEKVLKKNIDELQKNQDELNRRKEQLIAITEISNNYIDMVCEKFNVKKENIEKIRTEKR